MNPEIWFISGPYAFITSTDGYLQTVDISDPNNPRYIISYNVDAGAAGSLYDLWCFSTTTPTEQVEPGVFM